MAKLGPETPAAQRMKALADEGSNFHINPDTKAASYIRSGKELLRSANNYYDDQNYAVAFVLYTRFLTMFVERLREHPGYKDVPQEDKKVMKTYCGKILPKAESLRALLLSQYQKEHEAYQTHQEELRKKAEEAEARKTQQTQNSSVQDPSSLNWNYEGYHEKLSTDTKKLPVAATAPPSIPDQVSSYTDVMRDLEDREEYQGTLRDIPRVDRNTKPSRFLSFGNTGLRETVVPADTIDKFLKYAEPNTIRNVETCGFLTGRILQGRLVVTDLILPKQKGNSDSCDVMNEEEYFKVLDNFDLIVFGWIHTHPSQTAFLSSVDMHSQYCYQQMLPEAIAIVCSPNKQQSGTFILSPEGMEVIGKCPHTDGFHTHPTLSVPLFIDATHHRFDKDRKISIHDLRPT